MGCDFLCKKCGSEEINKPAAYGEKSVRAIFYTKNKALYVIYEAQIE